MILSKYKMKLCGVKDMKVVNQKKIKNYILGLIKRKMDINSMKIDLKKEK